MKLESGINASSVHVFAKFVQICRSYHLSEFIAEMIRKKKKKKKKLHLYLHMYLL